MIVLCALGAVGGLYISVAVLHKILPALDIDGYACSWSGDTLRYRLNGPLVLACICCVSLALPTSYTAFAANHYFSCLLAANILGLSASLLVVRNTPFEPALRCITADQKEARARSATSPHLARGGIPSLQLAPPRNALQHLFFGRCFNPRVFGIDLKMLLYQIGACGLEWNLLAAAALRMQLHGGALSLAMKLYLSLFAWFIFEYMALEVVHLYTYDLFAEKLGFKLTWGCLVFYPFFYGIGVWSLVNATDDIGMVTACFIATLFLSGWVLTRGANMQKFVHKRGNGTRSNWMGLPMRTVPGTAGRLLCGGFWGLSRHVNYAGELLQAIALALPGTIVASSTYYRALPWLYPLYYVALFVPRQLDDDVQLKAKYGKAAFEAYSAAVPYRIVPGLW